MLRLFTLAGTVTHVVVGTASLAWAAICMEPASWLQAGVEIAGPGVIGLAVAALALLAGRRSEFVQS
jgi:hypothetical protein